MRKGNKYRTLSSIPGFSFTYHDLTYTLWTLAKNVHVIAQNSYTEHYVQGVKLIFFSDSHLAP